MKQGLDRVFNPRTVAVVGDKRANDYMWLKCQTTFKGEVYSVQIDPNEIPGILDLGFQNYPSLADIPKPVDYVIVAVPRSITPRILHDCIEAGAGGASFFTSGFSETRTEEGKTLEEYIVRVAREAGFNLIGPNCMGVFNPSLGLRHDTSQYSGNGGKVGFIAQSGTHAIFFSLVGETHGFRVSKTISYGNAAVLESTDFLEYMSDDEQTEIIGMYIEGVKDGRRFMDVLKRAAKKKPVLIWAGGKTEDGARAAFSHTGSLSTNAAMWDAIIKQCGAIRVENLEQMVDTIKALLYIQPPPGNRVGLVAYSGGQSVVITDAFAKEGLSVPMLGAASYEEFASFFNIIGGSYMNPLDISWNLESIDGLIKSLNIVANDRNIDTVVLELCVPFLSQMWEYLPGHMEELIEALVAYKASQEKSFSLVLSPGQMEAEAARLGDKMIKAGFTTFPTFERSARAIKKVVDFHESRWNRVA